MRLVAVLLVLVMVTPPVAQALTISTSNPIVRTRAGATQWAFHAPMVVEDLTVYPTAIRIDGGLLDVQPLQGATATVMVLTWDATTIKLWVNRSKSAKTTLTVDTSEPFFSWALSAQGKTLTCGYPTDPCRWTLTPEVNTLVTLSRTALSLPSAPVLQGTIDGGRVSLSWTAPATPNGTILAYYVYRLVGTREARFELPATARTYEETIGFTQPAIYTVRAVNAAGPGWGSNPVTLSASPRHLLGDDSVLYGGDKAELASSLGVSVEALEILYGLLFVVLFAALAYMLSGGSGIAVAAGSTGGVLFAIGAGMFPLWVLMLVGMFAAVALLAWRGRGGDGDG